MCTISVWVCNVSSLDTVHYAEHYIKLNAHMLNTTLSLPCSWLYWMLAYRSTCPLRRIHITKSARGDSGCLYWRQWPAPADRDSCCVAILASEAKAHYSMSVRIFIYSMTSDLCFSHHVFIRLQVDSEGLADFPLSIIKDLDLHHMLHLPFFKLHIYTPTQS